MHALAALQNEVKLSVKTMRQILEKTIRLYKVTFNNTKRNMKTWKNLSESLYTKQRFRQGDSLSCDYFYLFLEKIMRAAELNGV